MDYSVAFWNRIARRYAASPISDLAAYEHKLSVTRGYLRPEMKALEFGCGTGSTAILHAPLVKHYHAIDVSPRMIDIAIDKICEKPQPNLTFEVAALEEFVAEKGSYDALLGLNILHLMNAPQAVITQVFELLKPGGVFISNTACLSDTMPLVRYITPVGKWLGLIPRVQMIAFPQLLDWLQQAGFIVEYCDAPGGKQHSGFIVATRPA